MKNAIQVAVLILFLAASMVCAQPAATTTALAVTSGGNVVTSVAPGTVITLTATVTAAGVPVSPGQVNFCDAAAKYCTDVHLLGMAQLVQSGPDTGTAALTFYPVTGVHSYKAVFLGTTTNAGSSSSPSSLAVTGTIYPTTTTIAQTGGPGNYTLTATVTGQDNLPPAGPISFLDTTNADYVLATAQLSPGTGASGLNFLTTWNLTADTSLWTGFPATDIMLSEFTADFNGDGKLDLAVLWYREFCTGLPTCFITSELDILLGNGDGTFTAAPPAVPIKEDLAVFRVAAGDFNNDGREDIVLLLCDPAIGCDNVGAEARWIEVLLGNGDGTFTTLPKMPIQIDVNSLAVGDFNGDGKLDIVATSAIPTGRTSSGLITGIESISTLLGNGDGTFQTPTPFQQVSTDYDIFSPFVVGDFDGDGKLDLAAAEGNDNTITVLLGNGDGSFTAKAQTASTGALPTAMTMADFNGDGIADLATANTNGGTATILLGNGDGTFTATPVNLPTGGPNPISIAVGAFSTYGTADLVTVNFTSATTVLPGNGDGTFAGPLAVAAGINPISVVTGDFNGDGLSDLALVENSSVDGVTVDVQYADAYVALDQATGFTSTAIVTGISPVGTGIHLVDASYPGNSSYGSSLSGTTPLVAERVPTTLALTAALAGSTGSGQLILTATITPSLAQGHTPTGAITFSNGSTSLGTATISNGVATLTVSELPPGANSITAVYPGDTNFAGSSSSAAIVNVDFSISAAPASQSVYTGLSATYTVTVTPSADFNLPVVLTCSQLPANTTCTFSSSTIAGGNGNAKMVVQTSAPGPASSASGLSARLYPPLLAVFFLFFIPRRRHSGIRKHWPISLVIMAALIAGTALTGCSAPGPLTGGTPAGAQSVTVTGVATIGSQKLIHAATVTLNVKSLF